MFTISSPDEFLKFCPSSIFVIGEARHFKFHVLIDIQQYE